MRKKTVRWTVFADVVKERSDAKATAVAEKNPLLSAIKKARFGVLFLMKFAFASEISFGYEIASL